MFIELLTLVNGIIHAVSFGFPLRFSVAVESTGEAKAEAQSRAEAAKIEGETAVAKAKLQAEAAMIEAVHLEQWIKT